MATDIQQVHRSIEIIRFSDISIAKTKKSTPKSRIGRTKGWKFRKTISIKGGGGYARVTEVAAVTLPYATYATCSGGYAGQSPRARRMSSVRGGRGRAGGARSDRPGPELCNARGARRDTAATRRTRATSSGARSWRYLCGCAHIRAGARTSPRPRAPTPATPMGVRFSGDFPRFSRVDVLAGFRFLLRSVFLDHSWNCV